MATASTAYVHDDLEDKAPGYGVTSRVSHPAIHPKISCSLRNKYSGEARFAVAFGQENWDHLMQLSHQGCKKSYGKLLHEIDQWLEQYLNEIDFLGNIDSIIIEVLNILNDKIATYDTDTGVISWLVSIVDYKIANTQQGEPRILERVGPFLVFSRPNRRKDLQS